MRLTRSRRFARDTRTISIPAACRGIAGNRQTPSRFLPRRDADRGPAGAAARAPARDRGVCRCQDFTPRAVLCGAAHPRAPCGLGTLAAIMVSIHASARSALKRERGTAAEDVFQRRRGMGVHEMMPVAMGAEIVGALGAWWVLDGRADAHALSVWLAWRLSVSVGRLLHSLATLRGWLPVDQVHMRVFRLSVLLDALVWSAMGWALTPLFNLEVAIVSLSMLVAVSAAGGLMLQMDLPSAGLFILPILVPNAFYAVQRGDDLGVACLLLLLCMAALLLVEARRNNRRIRELQRLRHQSDQVARAQAAALEQARVLAETRSRFVATMSHEMRTPLHGILGLARMARKRARDSEQDRQLELIRSSGEHLVGVINDVLDYARMENGGLPLHEEPFDLHALMGEVAETWRLNCQAKGLELRFEADLPAGQLVLGDPMRIRQVLYNLLGNAVKFTPEGFVALRAARSARTGRVDFSVQDSGIGIAPGEVAKVFEAFHQAEGTYRRSYGGTGLGLTISRELCVAMGGDLGCSSTVGEGSVFAFSLPLPVQQPPLGGVPRAPAHDDPASGLMALDGPEGGAPRVLLVEDNPVNALVAEAELVRLGMQVHVCGNGVEALAWLEQERADLILMDCEMPEMDGIEATRRIREHERRTGAAPVPIVALTANGPNVYAERCQAAGMNDHLLKPFHTEDLARVLSRYLQRSVA